MIRKPIVAMDLSVSGHGGGPHTSTSRIMSSSLADSYDFRVVNYDPKIGRFISFRRIQDLRRQIKSINPDIVHFTGLQLSGFHMMIACKLAGVDNTLLTIRGMSGDSIYFNPIKKWALKYIIEIVTLILVKRFYCVSSYVYHRRIPTLFSYKCEGFIYNYPPLSECAVNRSDARKEMGYSDDDCVVVSVARINREKGYHVLTEVIKKLRGKPNLKFLIVGDGSYLEEMKKTLGEQVHSKQIEFVGYKDNVQYYNLASDIFVLPTLHETLSVALLEASSARLALVASDTGGVPEIIEHSENGFLVTPNNASALADAISYLCDNPIERKRLGANAHEKLLEKFSEEAINHNIRNVYQLLLNN